ncbi:hypothetical protein CIK05_02940 [Bdellovibrio sp. qaytius]|nr:hypothetical protein CIK05_02940 [Bdellovibrio sp. qaytius]
MKLITVLITLLLAMSAFAADIPSEKPVEHGQIDFGLIPHNGSRTQVFTLTNNSEAPLTDISLKTTGDFTMRHNCPKALNAGESCRAKISVWAMREGGLMGRFTVRTSAKDYLYNLYGQGDRDPFQNIPHPPIPPRP